MTQFALQSHLLGPWLDGKNVLPQIKDAARNIFSSHTAYRSKYNRFHGVADTTFMFAWPKQGTMILSFLEQCVYHNTGAEDALMRQACCMCNMRSCIVGCLPDYTLAISMFSNSPAGLAT